MSNLESVGENIEIVPVSRTWGKTDALAILVWTAAVVWIFRDTVTLRGALFYFDITEINYPYRYFFAEELRAGRFSRWCPWLYCGLPLFSESQAGYLHPFKYLLYPWMETWKAFNLDTVLSVWMTGLGTYGWLRRHAGPAGSLTGAALLGLGGYTWAHLVHTSMINALASVPFALWALEWTWSTGRWRGVVLGGFALACQVFAGHLQDFLLTAGLIGVYGLYRAATEPSRWGRLQAGGMAVGLVVMGVLLSALQWVPSKELLDRSPRAGGLSHEELTYGSWHPELLPTLVVREAYGTRARDTDWMDGFYPYHEMNAYLGLVGLALAVIGGGGSRSRDRWTNAWVILAGLAGLLMLGKFTILYDYAHRIPILGSSREPVRFSLWLTVAVAALASQGVERLSRPEPVRLRWAGGLMLLMIVASIPILLYIYDPVWTDRARWKQPYHIARYRWLGDELAISTARTGLLVSLGFGISWLAARTSSPYPRSRIAALLPLVVLADLMLAHRDDCPTITPAYWTSPPESVRKLRADPGFVRVFGVGDRHSGEPGYASEPLNLLPARDALDWSLPAAWGIAGAKGVTPMIGRRLLDYMDHVKAGGGRLDLESVSHFVTGKTMLPRIRGMQAPEPAGIAFINHNPNALPRVRLVGRPVYADSQEEAIAAIERLGPDYRMRVVVEDPDRPLASSAEASGSARIVADLSERVEVETDARAPAYLVLADTHDPGWSATVDGIQAPIRPAFVAFRAVYLPGGRHTVVFRYRPAGFVLGLGITIFGTIVGLAMLVWGRSTAMLAPERGDLPFAGRWRAWCLSLVVCVIAFSSVKFGPGGRPEIPERWRDSIHRFTWGAGIEAMKENRM